MAPLDWSRVEIAVPRAPVPLPGVSMAGFRHPAPQRPEPPERRESRERPEAPEPPESVEIAMVAHPSVTLLIDLSDGLVCDTGSGRERGSVVAGLLPGDLRVGGRTGEILQVRLDPVVASSMLGAAPELSGAVVPLAGVWGADGEERLRTAGSWEQRFAVATEILGRAAAGRPRVDAAVAYAWRRTLVAGGRLRVEDLAGEVGWSRKRLWSRFRAQLGISPKTAARLARFDRAARLLAAGCPAAGVAVESGYADQSHLHREARAIAGLTPSAVAAAPWLAIDDAVWPVADGSPART
ncbi:AraC family transcriptional regulator [Actinoplanes sp. DH11]|uniref:helix-turn-helix domain-containing protein n=1 Tax=Actinoplanes sp. DH11 TaxID=2857011 RepID=UPI001E5D07AE|nr:AraC family transcriptional regulator [Actinoplanes sp. DH11]